MLFSGADPILSLPSGMFLSGFPDSSLRRDHTACCKTAAASADGVLLYTHMCDVPGSEQARRQALDVRLLGDGSGLEKKGIRKQRRTR